MRIIDGRRPTYPRPNVPAAALPFRPDPAAAQPVPDDGLAYFEVDAETAQRVLVAETLIAQELERVDTDDEGCGHCLAGLIEEGRFSLLPATVQARIGDAVALVGGTVDRDETLAMYRLLGPDEPLTVFAAGLTYTLSTIRGCFPVFGTPPGVEPAFVGGMPTTVWFVATDRALNRIRDAASTVANFRLDVYEPLRYVLGLTAPEPADLVSLAWALRDNAKR